MRRSVLFMRFFSVVILTILITALFTTLIYTTISRNFFTQIKENELFPKARALGDLLLGYGGDDEAARAILLKLMETGDEGDSLLDAFVVVTDEAGTVLMHSTALSEDYLAGMAEAAQEVLRGGELRTGQIPFLGKSSLVGVGVPIEADGQVHGAVLMLVPLYEAMVAMGSLNSALVMSLLLSLPIVALLVFYAIGVIVKPLRQMRDVALNMAGGNFDARADASQRGEVGQLARSLNYLSHELSRTISDLELERNRLRQTVDGLREGIVAVDALCRVTHHNPAVEKLFVTLPSAGAVSDARMRLIPDEAVWADFKKVIKSGEGLVRALRLPDRTLQISLMPLCGEDGSTQGAVGLFSDITESERLERTRRDYVANVSHEMRTPLTAMRALIEPLSDGLVTSEETRARYYSIMLRETMRLSRLINDLMELSRLQSGTLAFETERLSLPEILGEIGEKYAATAEDHDLKFEIRVDCAACPPVISNADRLEEILVILLDNAMKYTPEGGTVWVDAAWDARRVTVQVGDTGVGIDPTDQPYVFDRFYKVDKAHSGLGSGLGLAIARELIQIMGEEIRLKSEVGKGTVFYFTLKRALEGSQ